jgi:ribonucleoside-diphosphate reductase alpha chain
VGQTATTHDIPRKTLEELDGDELRARVFIDKYALRGPNGELLESAPSQMWDRVAREIASVEPDPERREHWCREFRWLLDGFRFIPGGRILHGAGNPSKVTLLNCYFTAIRDDSIEEIFDAAKRMARTYSRGGGIGTDVTILRPRGAPVHNAARHSTGAVSFMELFSLTTGTIGQSGRRGALMISIADHHPDVLDFCRVKRDLKSVRYANISVRVGDAFMRAVESDGPWTLWFENAITGRIERTIRARDLWDELITGAHGWAEPGVIFWDRVISWGTSNYGGMTPQGTNPCSEVPLEDGGACDLGSLNLSQFVLDPFTPNARVDYEALRRAVHAAVRFLDNVLTYNQGRHPLPEQEEAALRGRRIGLGITGLGDMLIMLGLRYDSDRAIEFAGRLQETIKLEAYRASVDLAREKGPFPAFDPDKHLAQPFFSTFPEELLEEIRRHGLRNVSLLTVPPVGSGSALAGCTSGIEPVFALSYVRRSESLSKERFHVLHPLVARYAAIHGIDLGGVDLLDDPHDYLASKLPHYFVTAHEIDPVKRVEMQAALQAHICQSISSTINLPRTATKETVARVYLHAWRAGLKGVTVYREGSREGVLITPEEDRRQKEDAQERIARRVVAIVRQAVPDFKPDGKTPEGQVEEAVQALLDRLRAGGTAQLQLVGDVPTLRPRPSILYGVTLPQKAPEGSLQVTVNEVDGQPFELIVHGGKTGSDILAIVQALARAASMLLRLQKLVSPIERLELLIDQWKGIKGSRQLGLGPNAVYSAPDAIARALERYIELKKGHAVEEQREQVHGSVPHDLPVTNGNMCPRCQQFSLVTEEGCTRCIECGFKEC